MCVFVCLPHNGHDFCLANLIRTAFDVVRVFRYFDAETVGLDFKGMVADLEAAPEGE